MKKSRTLKPVKMTQVLPVPDQLVYTEGTDRESRREKTFTLFSAYYPMAKRHGAVKCHWMREVRKKEIVKEERERERERVDTWVPFDVNFEVACRLWCHSLCLCMCVCPLPLELIHSTYNVHTQ